MSAGQAAADPLPPRQRTFGRSANVLAALEAARQGGLVTIGFTGLQGTAMCPLCDLCLVAPSDETAIIQQIYVTAAHAICGAVERDLAPPSPGGA